MTSAPRNRAVQAKAKEVLQELRSLITAESTERSIVEAARRLLTARGLPDTWYYNCHALVLVGSRSCESVSGQYYVPSEELVGLSNLVTIDLSPCDGEVWGDCARSFCVEDGGVVERPITPEFQEGLRVERALHAQMTQIVSTETTFHALYEFANDLITKEGFENLDFLGNIGHSIATKREDRIYVEKGNQRRINEVTCFTFEPHIRKRGGRWGFKHENIYFIGESGRAVEV